MAVAERKSKSMRRMRMSGRTTKKSKQRQNAGAAAKRAVAHPICLELRKVR